MDVLELRMNYSAFIKLNKFVKINDISAEIKEYVKNGEVINGKLDVSGNYLEEDFIKSNNFNEEIPFSIIFKNENFEIVDIDCVNLDYQIIDGRGIEVIFDVLIKYEEECVEESEDIIEIPVIVEEEKVDYEAVKEEKEEETDLLIEEKLDLCNDFSPTEEKNITETKKTEKKRVIKVCYYQDNKELDEVCNSNNIGIDKIFNDNKNTDFVKYKRVIIK